MPEIRPATPNDANDIAELVNIAGEGMPFYHWSKIANAGQEPWDIGRQKARLESGGFSWRNSHVMESDGKVAALLISYAIEEDPKPVNYDDLEPMLVPLQQLKEQVPDTWGINILATYEKFRGKGYARELMSCAESLASNAGKRGMSLIVADTNITARSLYTKMGYQELDEKPMVKQDWANSGLLWILMTKLF